ncbi:natural cytotoxicity triggering receptor 3 ligand 1-like [Narcine bancroftii]|uniref:natural cytotoxicity triggering receptor 3 ligand 1-like n=1 Tax=Narcine bancroftii TaxID=1343680 RepID=UPI0038320B2B
MESKASSSFLLEKVRFGDAGIYYCRAEGEVTGNGTGTNLIVMVSPEPLTISPKQPADGSLICRTSGFYPEDYSLSWFKNGQKITDGVTTRTQKTAEGLSEAVSYLKDSEPAQHGTVYGCKVVHSTLKIPALANYTVSSEGITISFPWWIYLCGGIFLLLLIALTLIYCKFCKYKVRKDKFQVKACVRCTQPIVTMPEYEKRNDVNDDILMISTDPSKSEVTNGPPKAKKHRKRKCDPMLV